MKVALILHWFSAKCSEFLFFLTGFFSRRFRNHRTAGEGGGYFFNSSLPLSPASQTLRHQLGNYWRASSWTQTRNLWFSSTNRQPLSYAPTNLHTLTTNQQARRPRNFFKLMKKGTLEGFFLGLSQKFISMDLPPQHLFYSRRGKTTPLSSKNIKRISEKFKNIQCCRSAIPEIRNILEK